MKSTQKTGVLLVNLGTPDSYQTKDVRKYLKQFLWDKRVIDIPLFFRFLLLYLFILPFRPKKSAAAYRSIWTSEGSPLAMHTANLAKKLRPILKDNYEVEAAMRYQNPSIASALDKLMQKSVEKIVVLPLFPQYSSAASGSALEEVYLKISNYWNVVPISTVPAFYNHPGFIDCFYNRAQEVLSSFKADYVLFSYHGLPERHILKSEQGQKNTCLMSGTCCDTPSKDTAFCYRAQCFATTRLLAQKLNLKEGQYSTSFQSRLGRAKWIEPYTDKVFAQIAQKGFKRLAVISPSFVADCLETLEEIAIRGKEDWLLCGGEDLMLIPSLNAQDDWVQTVATMVKEAAHVPC